MVLSRIKHKADRTLLRIGSRIRPAALRTALSQLWGSGTDLLLVHSAMADCGYFSEGIDDVLAALREGVGTLCLPTHTYCYPALRDAPGPIFDPATTASRNGILTETYRKQVGVVRSINATHSLAGSGPLVEEITKDHELLDAPCGKGSPWAKLVERKASVLLIGVSFRAYTPYHTAEDAADSPYAYEQGTIDRLRYVGQDGQVLERLSRRQSWAPRRFAEAGDLLECAGLAKRVPLGRGYLRFVPDSAKVHDFLIERLRKIPDFLYANCIRDLR
jgi:aminoglycoside 3-N-acetyltransferase